MNYQYLRDVLTGASLLLEWTKTCGTFINQMFTKMSVYLESVGELFGMSQHAKWIHRSVLRQSIVNKRFPNFFFMMAPSVQSSVPKTHKFKRLIIVVKRNNIPSRITLLAMLRAKSTTNASRISVQRSDG